MFDKAPRWPSVLALVAALLGLVFASVSTLDYAAHLDRQVHDLHCSFVPGLAGAHGADSACRTAMYSPYAALFRDRYWGGVPISLFAVGAFVFFVGFALYAVFAGDRLPRRAAQFFGVTSLAPFAASLVMFTISWLKLGAFCKTCVGIYAASTLLAIAGIALLREASRQRTLPPRVGASDTVVDEPAFAAASAPPPMSPLFLAAWLAGLAAFAVTPALLYVAALPSYAPYVTGCGTLEKATESHGALLRITPAGAVQPATMFVDPLCPTCKAFHQRLVADGTFDKLDTTLVLFPLDDACNWMLDRAVHPGACIVAKAVICADRRALPVLEWSYEHQDELLAAAKAGAGLVNVRAMIRQKWPELDGCIDQKETAQRLDRMLRYAVDNHLPVSTPQLFLGDTRLCDEDSDIGLSYTLVRLAPALRSK
jgi:uncharacterized membrane protein